MYSSTFVNSGPSLIKGALSTDLCVVKRKEEEKKRDEERRRREKRRREMCVRREKRRKRNKRTREQEQTRKELEYLSGFITKAPCFIEYNVD